MVNTAQKNQLVKKKIGVYYIKKITGRGAAW